MVDYMTKKKYECDIFAGRQNDYFTRDKTTGQQNCSWLIYHFYYCFIKVLIFTKCASSPIYGASEL